jgi:hypothetical protein
VVNQNWARAERNALCDLLAETGGRTQRLTKGARQARV